MARSTKFYGEWAEHDGKVVKIDGLKHKLKCSIYTARYPYVHEIIDVQAVPVSKGSRYYKQTMQELGDDWSTDVLDSSIELQADIWRQVSV